MSNTGLRVVSFSGRVLGEWVTLQMETLREGWGVLPVIGGPLEGSGESFHTTQTGNAECKAHTGVRLEEWAGLRL